MLVLGVDWNKIKMFVFFDQDKINMPGDMTKTLLTFDLRIED